MGNVSLDESVFLTGWADCRIQKAILFGSRGRDYVHDSDIDMLLVSGDFGRPATGINRFPVHRFPQSLNAQGAFLRIVYRPLLLVLTWVLMIGGCLGSDGEGKGLSVDDCECGIFSEGLDALALTLNRTQSGYNAEDAYPYLDCVYDDPGGFRLRIMNCSTPEEASGLVSQAAIGTLGDLAGGGGFPPETGEGIIESSPLVNDRFSLLIMDTIEEGLMKGVVFYFGGRGFVYLERYVVLILGAGTDQDFASGGQFKLGFDGLEDHARAIIAGKEEKEYTIGPLPLVVKVGEKITLQVIEVVGDQETPLGEEEEVTWTINRAGEASASPYFDIMGQGIHIGRIDRDTGVFEGLSPGTSMVVARWGEYGLRGNVTVRCAGDKGLTDQEKIDGIVELFKNWGYRGPIWEYEKYIEYLVPPGSSLPGSIAPEQLRDRWRGLLSQITQQVQQDILSKPGADPVQSLQGLAVTPGYLNDYVVNILSGSFPAQLREWRQHDCGGCQDNVLKFIDAMKGSAEQCHLLEGICFGPIYGGGGAHNAVVLCAEGQDWRTHGVVLDPWVFQTAWAFSIDQWEGLFPYVGGSILKDDRDNFPCVVGPHDFENVWPWWDIFYQIDDITTGWASCPVNLVFTDDQGRRTGILPDGSTVHEIPNAIVLSHPDEGRGRSFFFELDNEISGSYDLEITGTADGEFALYWSSTSDPYTRYYGTQPIGKDSTARITFNTTSPGEAALTMPNGTKIPPQPLEFVYVYVGEKRAITTLMAMIVIIITAIMLPTRRMDHVSHTGPRLPG